MYIFKDHKLEPDQVIGTVEPTARGTLMVTLLKDHAMHIEQLRGMFGNIVAKILNYDEKHRVVCFEITHWSL